MLPTNNIARDTQTEYVTKLRDRLSFVYEKACQTAKTTGLANITAYWLEASKYSRASGRHCTSLQCNPQRKAQVNWPMGTTSICGTFSPHSAQRRTVKKEGVRFTKSGILHRNRLLPFMSISVGSYLAAQETAVTSINNIGQEKADTTSPSQDRSRRYKIPMRRPPSAPGLSPPT